MYCLETNNLTHRFSKNDIVLKDINLGVTTGSIYGFLGPNGAGKTTTLRLVLGLLKKQQGDILVFGKSFESNRVNILKNIGSLIENPSFYGHLTATENLLLLQKIHQCPKERIKEVLDLVGLPSTGNKKAGRFSLGMKQRLTIAGALLHDPLLLILDEPTNGLDPNGMIELRELLTRLNQSLGITIVISSHLLSEIEKLVTHVGVINKGEMIFQGTMAELKNMQQRSLSVIFDTNDVAKTLQVIREINITATVEGGKVIMAFASKEMIAVIIQKLVMHEVEVYEVSIIKNDLETIFMSLINN